MLIQIVKEIKTKIIFLFDKKVEKLRNIFRKISKSGDIKNGIHF